jgi:hypothetical protein
MLRILRTYYARWKLHHVDPAAFEAVAEEVSHRDLRAFFAQWLHDVVRTDYAVAGASRSRADSGWRTTVRVQRNDPGQFPVMVAVLAEHDTAVGQVDGVARHDSVVLRTDSKPRKVLLDPLVWSHDWNMLNNQHTFGFSPIRTVFGDEPTQQYLDTWFSPRSSRDARTVGWMPTAWWNDPGGVTAGVHVRENYLGRFDRLSAEISYGTGAGAVDSLRHHDVGVELSLENPTWWQLPQTTERVTAFRVEGRIGLGLRVERDHQSHPGSGAVHTLGASLSWLATYDSRYLRTALWDNGGTLEGAVWAGVHRSGRWDLRVTATAAAGVMYTRPGDGITTVTRYDGELYARPQVEASVRHALGGGVDVGIRGYVAAVFSTDPVIAQRRLYAAGGDPYQRMANPFLRSVGAPLQLDGCWCRWQTPGGGDVRGLDETLSSDRLAAVNVELSKIVLRPRTPVVQQVVIAGFADVAALGDHQWFGGAPDSPVLALYPEHLLADAGVGLRMVHRIGRTTFQSRLDVPLYVSSPAYAIAQVHHDVAPGRLVLSLSAVIP